MKWIDCRKSLPFNIQTLSGGNYIPTGPWTHKGLHVRNESVWPGDEVSRPMEQLRQEFLQLQEREARHSSVMEEQEQRQARFNMHQEAVEGTGVFLSHRLYRAILTNSAIDHCFDSAGRDSSGARSFAYLARSHTVDILN